MFQSRNPAILWAIPVLFAVCLVSFPAHAKYSGGSGEPNDPYQIATAADLILLGGTPEDYGKHFILITDIDLDPNLPGGRVFDRAVIAPDVNDTDPPSPYNQRPSFAGFFDGNRHVIRNLQIRGGGYLGLFGCTGFEAKISNLGLEAVDVNGTGGCVGGLVGYNGWYGGSITTCYSSGTVRGTSDVGGLVGWNGGSITASYSSGSISGTSSVGGLVGVGGPHPRMVYGSSLIASCYSSGSVSGTSSIGGLAGFAGKGSTRSSYSTGSVTATERGGGAGRLYRGGADITSCFWDIQTSGQETSWGGTGLTTAEMQTAGTFLEAGWDFVGETANGTEDIWWIDESKDYPRLWWEKQNLPAVDDGQ